MRRRVDRVSRGLAEDEVARLQNGDPVHGQACLADDRIEVNRNRHRPADRGARPEGHVDRAEDLLVLEDVSREPGLIVRPDAQLGEFVPSSPWAPSRRRYSGPRPPRPRPACRPRASTRPARPTARVERDSSRRSGPLRAGAMNASPHGRLPNAPGAVRSPSSAMPLRPRSAMVAWVPCGQVIRATSPAVNSPAAVLDRRAILSKSTAITRPSISAVTPGIVAPRAPASVAFLRAVVWLSDLVVAATYRSQAPSAAAIGGGGSVPSVARSSMITSTASAPRSAAASRSDSPIARVPGSTTTRAFSRALMPRQRSKIAATASRRTAIAGILCRPRRRACS